VPKAVAKAVVGKAKTEAVMGEGMEGIEVAVEKEAMEMI